MRGRTHKVLGVLATTGTYVYLKSNGLIPEGVSEQAALLYMYPYAYFGATWSDLDHHKNSIPTRDPASLLINSALRITHPLAKFLENKGKLTKPLYNILHTLTAKHRSWQTHSIDLFALYLLFLMNVWSRLADSMQMVVLGFTVGYASHLIADALTPSGIRIAFGCIVNELTGKRKLPYKISLVPNTQFFVTDGSFETGVYWVASILMYVSLMLIFAEWIFKVDIWNYLI